MGMFAGAIFVSPGSRGLTVADDPAVFDRPTPGFLYGVDLRGFASVALVLDLGMPGCPRLPEIEAAVAGLPPAAQATLVGASGGYLQRIVPETAAGRTGAVRWLLSLPCQGGRSLARSLRRAFEARPAVVVLISDFRTDDPAERERIARDSPADALSYADEIADIGRMESEPPPVVVVSFAPANPRGPQIAALTNGAYVTRPRTALLAAASPGPRGVAGPPRESAPAPTSDGGRVSVGSEAPPGCRLIGPVSGASGVAMGRPTDLDQAAFERWLPRDAAMADARNQAARLGGDLLVPDARGTLEIDWPALHQAGYGVAGRAFRCGPPPR